MDLCAQFGPPEAGIPVPPKRQLTPLGAQLRSLRPGDSFVCETEEARDNAKSTARYAGIPILIRKAKGGWRIWRKA